MKEQDADSSDGLGEVVPYRSFGGHIPDFASLPARLAPLATNHAFITEASANQVTDVCIERFLNDFSPASAAVSGSVVEWRTAAALKDSSLLLNRAFTAAALTLGGFREGDQSLRMAGQVRYIGVLRLLQSTLNHPTESLSTGALIVVVLFTIIEVCRRAESAPWANTVAGL